MAGAALPLALLTAASAGVQAHGQRRAARGAQRAGQLEGEFYDMNAELAAEAADDAIARGAETAGRYRSGIRNLIGAQRAGFAGQGVDISSGSAADVQSDTAAIGELDAITIENNAKREAYGFRVEEWRARAGGRLARAGGNAQAAQLRSQSYSTLLSGAAGIYDIYRPRD